MFDPLKGFRVAPLGCRFANFLGKPFGRLPPLEDPPHIDLLAILLNDFDSSRPCHADPGDRRTGDSSFCRKSEKNGLHTQFARLYGNLACAKGLKEQDQKQEEIKGPEDDQKEERCPPIDDNGDHTCPKQGKHGQGDDAGGFSPA